jgi:hypothetical protein
MISVSEWFTDNLLILFLQWNFRLLHKLNHLSMSRTNSAQRGSISAEHGLGLMKAEKIDYSKSPEAVRSGEARHWHMPSLLLLSK